MALIDKINDGFRQLATLLKGKVDKTATIGIANGGTGATTLTAAQTALGIDKVISANTRLTTAKQAFPNVFVDSNGQLRKTQFATWLDHAKMYNGLVPNGSFQMGDATGWVTDENKTLVTTDFPFGAFGCIKMTGDINTTYAKIAVNPYQTYRHSGMFKYEKAIASGGGILCGIKQYDVDNNEIFHQHAYHYGNTVTTLAQDLKIGDTKVYLTSLANWKYNVTPSNNGFKFYNYVDSRGYLYDPSIMPYSQYVSFDWWDSSLASSFDTNNNAITLKKPWSYSNPKDTNGTWLAGTKIAQVANGNNRIYDLLANWMSGQSGITQWTYFTNTIGGINLSDGELDNSKFRAGTAYIAPFHTGTVNAGDYFKFSHHYFEKI